VSIKRLNDCAGGVLGLRLVVRAAPRRSSQRHLEPRPWYRSRAHLVCCVQCHRPL